MRRQIVTPVAQTICCVMLAAVGACKSAAVPSGIAIRAGAAPAPGRATAIDASARVYRSDAGAITDSLRQVVRDAAAWGAMWQRLTANETSPPPMPQVDFTKEMLLVAAAGRMSPGDEIRIDSIAVQDKTLSVIVRTRVECKPFPGTSYPLEVAKIRKSDERVVFLERREKTECH